MIIVEGADNCGKTTLVQRLMDLDSDLKLLKRKRFNPTRGESIGSSYIQALVPDTGDWIAHGYTVADRLLASECIYGDLFRGGHRVTPEQLRVVRLLLNAYEAIIVHCDVPDEVILKSWTDREQLYNDPLIIAKAYRERIHDIFRRPVMRFDWTDPNADEHFHHIVVSHAYVQEQIRAHDETYRGYFDNLAHLLTPSLKRIP